jgi:hypothetical protein
MSVRSVTRTHLCPRLSIGRAQHLEGTYRALRCKNHDGFLRGPCFYKQSLEHKSRFVDALPMGLWLDLVPPWAGAHHVGPRSEKSTRLRGIYFAAGTATDPRSWPGDLTRRE